MNDLSVSHYCGARRGPIQRSEVNPGSTALAECGRRRLAATQTCVSSSSNSFSIDRILQPGPRSTAARNCDHQLMWTAAVGQHHSPAGSCSCCSSPHPHPYHISATAHPLLGYSTACNYHTTGTFLLRLYIPCGRLS